jgi:hypothetical protein
MQHPPTFENTQSSNPLSINQSSTKASNTVRPIKITVSRTEAKLLGKFVVTFAKPGPTTCKELLNAPTIHQLLANAEENGVAVQEPALLAMVDDQSVARSVLITPQPEANMRGYAVWIGWLIDTIKDLKTDQVAIYLCKNGLNKEDTNDLLQQSVRALIESGHIAEVGLVVGSHSYNDVLRTALTIKTDLVDPSLNISVLH